MDMVYAGGTSLRAYDVDGSIYETCTRPIVIGDHWFVENKELAVPKNLRMAFYSRVAKKAGDSAKQIEKSLGLEKRVSTSTK